MLSNNITIENGAKTNLIDFQLQVCVSFLKLLLILFSRIRLLHLKSVLEIE